MKPIREFRHPATRCVVALVSYLPIMGFLTGFMVAAIVEQAVKGAARGVRFAIRELRYDVSEVHQEIIQWIVTGGRR